MVSLKENFQLLTSQKINPKNRNWSSAIYKQKTHRHFKMPTAFSRSHFISNLSSSPLPVTFMCCNFCLLTNSDLTLLAPSPSPTKVFRDCLHLASLSLNWFLIKRITYSANKYLLYIYHFLNTILVVNVPDQAPILMVHSRCRVKRINKW